MDGEPLIDVLPEGDDPPIDILLEEDDGQGEPLMDVLPEEDEGGEPLIDVPLEEEMTIADRLKSGISSTLVNLLFILMMDFSYPLSIQDKAKVLINWKIA